MPCGKHSFRNRRQFLPSIRIRTGACWHPSRLKCYGESQMPFVTTTEAGVQIQGPTATLLYDDWYPALRTDELRRNKLATAMLLDIPLVLGQRARWPRLRHAR